MSAADDPTERLHVVVRPTPLGDGAIARERVLAQRRAARAARAEAAEAAGAGADLELEQAPDGRPLPAGPWHWSISHDAALVAAVVRRGPVGVDLERVRARRAELVERVLDARERALLDGTEGFIRAWTAKEAVLKATALGLSGLGRCRVVERLARDTLVVELDGARWSVAQRLLATHVLAVTAGPRAIDVAWDLPRGD